MFLDDLKSIKEQMQKTSAQEAAEREEKDKFKRLQDEFEEYLDSHMK